MVFFIAGYLYERGKGITLSRHIGLRSWVSYGGPFVLMCFFAVLPLFIQRDLGPTVLIFIVFLLMFYYSENPISITLIFVLLVALGAYASYHIGYPGIVHERFEMMFDPFGKSESMSRALWSICSGGIFGAGLGFGQPYRIPEVQSDYNFAAICEEMGWIGGMVVIFGYAIIIHRCFRISLGTENTYKKIIVVCVATFIGVQAFMIICGNLGAIPMAGLTLPFVSFGGSSMVINFLMLGMVLRISGDK